MRNCRAAWPLPQDATPGPESHRPLHRSNAPRGQPESAGHSTVGLVFNDGRTSAAAIVASDPGVDLALLRMPVPPGSVGYVKFGSSASFPLASDMTILGYLLCLQSLTVTRGIFSSRIYDGVFEYLQTDAAVNPGNSG
ncbi:MAG: serine protease, partial [Chloroflexota bacterium]|nr:serine protease [Chloroflexota bacterium]